jgi:hypothetical protein
MVDSSKENSRGFSTITINQYQKPIPFYENRKKRLNVIYTLIIFLISLNILFIIKQDNLFEGNAGAAIFSTVFINLMFIIGIIILIYNTKKLPAR